MAAIGLQPIAITEIAEFGISGATWTPAIVGRCYAFNWDPLQGDAEALGISVHVWLQRAVVAGLWQDHPKQRAFVFYVPGNVLRLFICMKREKHLKGVYEALSSSDGYMESGQDSWPTQYASRMRPLLYWEPPCTMVALWPRGTQGEVWDEPSVVDTGNLMGYFSYPESDHDNGLSVDEAGLEYVRVPQREDEAFVWGGKEYRVVHRYYELSMQAPHTKETASEAGPTVNRRDSRSAQVDNKWRGGKRDFSISPLPASLKARTTVHPLSLTVSPEVGEEVLLVWVDPTPFVYKLAKVDPFELHVTAGVAKTDAGPIIFILFWVSPQPWGTEAFAIQEVFLDPRNEEALDRYGRLARQSHWHLLIPGLNDEVLAFLEFENTYELDKTLDAGRESVDGSTYLDFQEACREFQETYELEELIAPQLQIVLARRRI